MMTGTNLFGENSDKRDGFAHEINNEHGKDEWLTPPEIIKALGPFELDPASPIKRPWATAACHYNALDDGLKRPWMGRVWLNPPYNNFTPKWVKRLAEHGNGIALIYARVETGTFFPWVWYYATGIFFFDYRITFLHGDGSKPKNHTGAPSCLVIYGQENYRYVEQAHLSDSLKPKNQRVIRGRLVALKG